MMVVGAVVGGVAWPERPSLEAGRRVSNDDLSQQYLSQQYLKAARTIEENHFQEHDRRLLTKQALERMLSELDPHSRFFDNREFAEMQNEQTSKYFGTGATIGRRGGRFYVLGVGKGTPAERAGLRYGDELAAVDGESTSGWTPSDMLKNVRGERGTPIRLTVERAGEGSLTYDMLRDEVPYRSVRIAFILRPGVGYIGLTGGFSLETTRELQESIAGLKRQGMESLVLDLRGNPGGLLTQAMRVAETFLEKGREIVSVRGREGGRGQQIYRSENSTPEQQPLALLIDGETASASEIVAGAMQDHGRAVIVGEESFGKGLVQTVFRLNSATGLALTTARYFTPSGRSIQRDYQGAGRYRYLRRRSPTERWGGIEPEIRVIRPVESLRLRDACFAFARQFSAAMPGASAADPLNRLRAHDYVIPQTMITTFRRFLRSYPEWQVSDAEIERGRSYIASRLRTELIAVASGSEAAEESSLSVDVQVLRAAAAVEKLARKGKFDAAAKSLEK